MPLLFCVQPATMPSDPLKMDTGLDWRQNKPQESRCTRPQLARYKNWMLAGFTCTPSLYLKGKKCKWVLLKILWKLYSLDTSWYPWVLKLGSHKPFRTSRKFFGKAKSSHFCNTTTTYMWFLASLVDRPHSRCYGQARAAAVPVRIGMSNTSVHRGVALYKLVKYMPPAWIIIRSNRHLTSGNSQRRKILVYTCFMIYKSKCWLLGLFNEWMNWTNRSGYLEFSDWGAVCLIRCGQFPRLKSGFCGRFRARLC